MILADSGVIDQVQANEFEVAIGSSGTIESIEQMIHYTVTTTSAPQVRVGYQVREGSHGTVTSSISY